MKITNDQITELLRLDEERSPGPWFADNLLCSRVAGDDGWRVAIETHHSDDYGNQRRVAVMEKQGKRTVVVARANGEYIAASANLAPELAREVMRLREGAVKVLSLLESYRVEPDRRELLDASRRNLQQMRDGD